MATLILQGNDIDFDTNGLTLVVGSLALTMEPTGAGSSYTLIPYLVLSGTTSVSIASDYGGANTGEANNGIGQLLETNNQLTTVTISGSQSFLLGGPAGYANGESVVTDIDATAISPTTIASSLTLINASATTGGVDISAGATNTGGAGDFANGASLNADVTITYTGLEIEGGSGNDLIENDAKNGIVIDGNGTDFVILGGAGAKAILGTGAHDRVEVGSSGLGTNEAAGDCVGDKVTFGAAATATLIVGTGAEAGATAGTTSIGLTKVHDAAAGMVINFLDITNSSNIVDENTAVAGATSPAAAENAAVKAMGGAGVAYFNYGGSEYFIATNNTETSVSSTDAIVKLVGVVDLTATNAAGVVTLHA